MFFFVGVVVFLCRCGDVFVVVFFWWCFCGAVRCVLAFVPPLLRFLNPYTC